MAGVLHWTPTKHLRQTASSTSEQRKGQKMRTKIKVLSMEGRRDVTYDLRGYLGRLRSTFNGAWQVWLPAGSFPTVGNGTRLVDHQKENSKFRREACERRGQALRAERRNAWIPELQSAQKLEKSR
jgi:hypothetical protein